VGSSPHSSAPLSTGAGRDRRVPAGLKTAVAESAVETALPVCGQCRASTPEADFIYYVFDFAFERDPALRPDPEAVKAHGEGECRDWWDSAPDAGWRGKCVRCGRAGAATTTARTAGAGCVR
jgi:hypothetical protein